MFRHLSGKLLGSIALVGLFTTTHAFGQATTQPFDPAKPTVGKAAVPADPNARQPAAPAGNAANQPGQPAAGAIRVQRPNYDQNLQRSLDSDIAMCLLLENQNEVALAKLAQEKAKHDDVKKFAKMLEEDHSKMVATLKKFTDGRADQRSTNAAQPAAGAQPATAAQQPAIAGQAGGQSLENAHRQMKHELAEQCLADAKKELSDKESHRFDECFVGMQIAGHMKMHTELTVMQRHVSSELKSVIDDGLKTTDSHLKEAKELMEDLAKDSKDSKKTEK